MNILLGNNTLSILAGSETWTMTLATELKRLGHNVTAFSPELGFIATKLEGIGVKCVNEISGGNMSAFSPVFEEPENNFDVIICSHYEITKYLHSRLPNVPIIAVVHGIIHKGENGEIWPEHPVTEFKVDQYISVSEEVRDILNKEYGIESKIIRNFFDLDKFKKEGSIPPAPKTFLINSNYSGVNDDITNIAKEIAIHYGGQLIGIGVNYQPTFEVDEIMAGVDVVFGMGRSVLEGVCMGKLGIVHGRWGTGGIINPDSAESLREVNFSGRRSPGLSSPEQLIAEIDKNFNQATIDKMREYMEKEHNVKVAAQKFIEIAQDLIKK